MKQFCLHFIIHFPLKSSLANQTLALNKCKLVLMLRNKFIWIWLTMSIILTYECQKKHFAKSPHGSLCDKRGAEWSINQSFCEWVIDWWTSLSQSKFWNARSEMYEALKFLAVGVTTRHTDLSSWSPRRYSLSYTFYN